MSTVCAPTSRASGASTSGPMRDAALIRRDTRPYSATVSCACRTRSSAGSSSLPPRMMRSTDDERIRAPQLVEALADRLLRLDADRCGARRAAARRRTRPPRPAAAPCRRRAPRPRTRAPLAGVSRPADRGASCSRTNSTMLMQYENANAVDRLASAAALSPSGGRAPARPAPRPGPGVAVLAPAKMPAPRPGGMSNSARMANISASDSTGMKVAEEDELAGVAAQSGDELRPHLHADREHEQVEEHACWRTRAPRT